MAKCISRKGVIMTIETQKYEEYDFPEVMAEIVRQLPEFFPDDSGHAVIDITIPPDEWDTIPKTIYWHVDAEHGTVGITAELESYGNYVAWYRVDWELCFVKVEYSDDYPGERIYI